jgi:4-hydroxy-4-methyl-2-oxoglutarate aldolase
MTAAQGTDETIDARIAALDVCSLSDAMDALGIAGVVDGLRPLWEGAKVAGRAVTMKLGEGRAPADAPAVHLGARAVGLAGPGRVIVVDNDGRDTMGSWGGLLSAAALAQGVEGVVTDGACRDVDEARDLRFPVFARGGAVRTARARVHEVSANQPVSLAGTTVEPGDFVVGDGSGVVIVPAAEAERVVDKAEQLLERERIMLQALQSGVPAVEVLDGTYENALNPAEA